jgi:hypothetical protein
LGSREQYYTDAAHDRLSLSNIERFQPQERPRILADVIGWYVMRKRTEPRIRGALIFSCRLRPVIP